MIAPSRCSQACTSFGSGKALRVSVRTHARKQKQQEQQQQQQKAAAPPPAAPSVTPQAQQPSPPASAPEEVLATPSTSEQASSSAPVTPVRREWVAFGDKVLETNETIKGPEDVPDFWEGEQWELFGTTMQRWFVPALIAFGVVAGSIAAGSYNEGATSFVAPAAPDRGIEIIPADALAPPPK